MFAFTLYAWVHEICCTEASHFLLDIITIICIAITRWTSFLELVRNMGPHAPAQTYSIRIFTGMRSLGDSGACGHVRPAQSGDVGVCLSTENLFTIKPLLLLLGT
jgi:hypothetical protein